MMLPRKVSFGPVVGVIVLAVLLSGLAGTVVGYRFGVNEPVRRPEPAEFPELGMTLKAAWFGDDWPFVADEIYLNTWGTGAVVARIDGIDYALNGLAGSTGIPKPMPPISKTRPSSISGLPPSVADWDVQRAIGLELHEVRIELNTLLRQHAEEQ
jgi:hypothetical protein